MTNDSTAVSCSSHLLETVERKKKSSRVTNHRWVASGRSIPTTRVLNSVSRGLE